MSLFVFAPNLTQLAPFILRPQFPCDELTQPHVAMLNKMNVDKIE